MYAALSTLSVIFAYFLVGSLKHFLLQRFFLLFLVRSYCLGYPSSDDSDESDEEESNKLGSESGSDGTFGAELRGFLCGVGLPLCVTLAGDDGGSCNGDGVFLNP